MLETNSKKGTVVISVDLELSWGSGGKHSYVPLHEKEREILNRFLALCNQYSISCTWATVGNLLLKNREEAKRRGIVLYGRAPHIYEQVIGTGNSAEHLWFGEDIVQSVIDSPVHQELASHSFFHTRAPEANRLDYKHELIQVRQLAKDKFGIDIVSYVHPRNLIGHLDVLNEVGFKNYRGNDRISSLPKILGAGGITRLIEVGLGLAIPPAQPHVVDSGLVNVPASYFLATTLFKEVHPPVWRTVSQCRKSIEETKGGGIFHLWFHPHNIARNQPHWFSVLEQLFSYISQKQKEGSVAVMTMGEVTRRVSEYDGTHS